MSRTCAPTGFTSYRLVDRELNTDVPTVPFRQSFPVTVVLGRRELRRRFWSLPSWRLAGVLVGHGLSAAGPRGEPVLGVDADDPDAERLFRWSGLEVTLYRDAAERYWQGLIGTDPKIHVRCRERTDESEARCEPVAVTIDYDEALAWGDMDETVLSCPLPAELYRAMERFVVQHYRPTTFVKRKRKRWHQAPGRVDRDAASIALDDPERR